MVGKGVWVPGELMLDPSLPLQARFLYVALLGLSTRRNECSPPQRELLALLGISGHLTLQKYIRILTESGWLDVKPPRGNKPATYILRNPYQERRQHELGALKGRLDRAEHKGEALMREWLNLLVVSTRYYDHARPDFLVNPLTSQPMEYDRWYPPGVAFEFNGPQHYGTTELYPDPEKAKQTMARDAMKKGLSLDNGVTLLVVRPEDLSLDGMRRLIGNLLPLRQVDEDDLLLRYLTLASNAYRLKAGTGARRPLPRPHPRPDPDVLVRDANQISRPEHGVGMNA